MDLYPALDAIQTNVTEDAVYFFSDAAGVLCNWSAHGVTIWGQYFQTVEHAYHYCKFQDVSSVTAEQIKQAASPYIAMKIAQKNKSYRRSDWENIKVATMREITRAKYRQHDDARQILLDTGDRLLVENSPWDYFWGCGADGNGQNIMGKILMEVRQELRSFE